MEERSPETRRRVRTNAPAAGFLGWIALVAAILIGIVFLLVYLT